MKKGEQEMLDFLTRRTIQKEIQQESRQEKKQIFKEVNVRLTKCDQCPFKELASHYEKEGAANPYEIACGACNNYREIRKLGNHLWNTQFSVEYLLKKGDKLNTNEVFYLIEIGAKRKDIQKALGMKYPKQLREYLSYYQSSSIDGESKKGQLL